MPRMRRALLLIACVLALGGVGCEALLQTPTARPQEEPASVSGTDPEDAHSIVTAAEENLRDVSSFRLSVTAEGSGPRARAESDVLPFGGGRLVIEVLLDAYDDVEIEVIQSGDAQYVLYPGFQSWFDFGEVPLHPNSNLKSFPYDLGGVRESAESFEVLGEGIVSGLDAFRIVVRGTGDFREAAGFPPGVGEAELMMWISKADLLPLRIEARVKDPDFLFTSVYSDYDSDGGVSAPENVVHVGLMDGLLEGALSPEQLGQVVRALPVSGQKCIEAEIGTEEYRVVIGGDSEADIPVLNAFNKCRGEIFP